MNNINKQTNRQYHSLAPSTLTYKGKKYKSATGMFSDETNTVFFKHFGRKQKGAFMKDQLSIIVQYDKGSDTYSITGKHFDGAEMESYKIFSYDGMYFDSFENIQNYINFSA